MRRIHLSTLALAVSALLLAACEPEPGSTKWCEAMAEKPKSEWTLEDGKTYATHCIIDSTTIGSEAWCEKLEEKDKEDWTAGEAADYAKHCVI